MTPEATAKLYVRQEIAAQYVKYAHAFNKRDFPALQQMLTPDCTVDVRGGKPQMPLAYVKQEMLHSQILKIKVRKVVVNGKTATALVSS